MKFPYFYYSPFWIIGCCFWLQDLIAQQITIPASYADSKNPPIQVTKNNTYRFDTNQVFLVNSNVYNALKNVYEFVGNQGQMTQAILKKYTSIIRKNQSLQQQLDAQASQSDALEQKSLILVNKMITETQQNFDRMLRNMDIFNQSLLETEKNIRVNRRKKWLHRIWIGLGGLSAGILVGIAF